MRLVICDDNLNDLTEFERLAKKYSVLTPGVQFHITKFSDPSLLAAQIQTGKPADIYILDIVMSGMTGIDLGNEIRRHNSNSIIIYVTSSDSFALDAYEVHAVRYLLKPVGESKFFEALDYALTHLEEKKEAVYLVKTKEGLESIPYAEIEYIENSSRKLEVHLADGKKITSIYIRKSFEEETKELIHAKSFIYVHKSFLVNLYHVRRLNQSNVTMKSGVNIPISKKCLLDVKKEYLLFISEQYK
ncbi:MAG: response regulator transcription factor [Eubacterium sp.]|nr:response regulator transcription factor [Eubacterium sp.]